MTCLYLISIVFVLFTESLNVKGHPPTTQNIVNSKVECEGGTLLSSSVCVPIGYRKGEVPKAPTMVNTRIEINNIREIND